MSDFLSQIGPAGLDQLMAQLTQEEQDADLQNQIEQARAIRGAGRGSRSWPGLLGLMVGAFDSLGAKHDEQAAMAKRQELWGQREAGRRGFAEAFMANRNAPQFNAEPLPSGPHDIEAEELAAIPKYLRRPAGQ